MLLGHLNQERAIIAFLNRAKVIIQHRLIPRKFDKKVFYLQDQVQLDIQILL